MPVHGWAVTRNLKAGYPALELALKAPRNIFEPQSPDFFIAANILSAKICLSPNFFYRAYIF